MPDKGYTLVELLIVITIMAIMAIVAYANFKDFSNEQIAKKAASEIQSLLREAQSNAQAGVLCEGFGGVSWSVQFKSGESKVYMYCEKSQQAQKTLILENAKISSIVCYNNSIPVINTPLGITYLPLKGEVKFQSTNPCAENQSVISVTVETVPNPDLKTTLLISKGGTINVE